MKIGLIDVDGHHFPNIALMKIASYHRQQGDTAEWAIPMFEHENAPQEVKLICNRLDLSALAKVWKVTKDRRI